MAFEALAICGRVELDQRAQAFAASHILSVLHPADDLRRPQGIASRNHLRVDMDDTDDIRAAFAPVASHIKEASTWCASLPDDSRLVVHCLAGISRSPAMALGLLAEIHDPERASRLVRRMRRQATPNPRVVALWDAHLVLEGALIAAVERTFDKPVWMRRRS